MQSGTYGPAPPRVFSVPADLPARLEQILRAAARDGSLPADEWPDVLQAVLSRLEQIVYHDFPIPRLPVPEPVSAPASLQLEEPASQDSQSADKENAPPPASSPSRPPIPAFSQSQTEDQNASSQEAPQLPGEIATLYNAVRTTLARNFPQKPPHTIQRLAELILSPTAHYRFLPSYLRALDRIVNVSSPATIFPLPHLAVASNSGLINGASPIDTANMLGSDESLGGALLTPIPWLRAERAGGSQSELVSESTEMVDGPHGAGRIETVSVMNGLSMSPGGTTPVDTLRDMGGVTQGELLRQEQEAGVVPSTQKVSVEETDDVEEEQPHARGPEEIGMEDTGPQATRPSGGGGLDIEGAVGRRTGGQAEHNDGPSESGTTEDMPDADAGEAAGQGEDSKDADADGEADPDTVLADVDGNAEPENKDNSKAAAADATSTS